VSPFALRALPPQEGRRRMRRRRVDSARDATRSEPLLTSASTARLDRDDPRRFTTFQAVEANTRRPLRRVQPLRTRNARPHSHLPCPSYRFPVNRNNSTVAIWSQRPLKNSNGLLISAGPVSIYRANPHSAAGSQESTQRPDPSALLPPSRPVMHGGPFSTGLDYFVLSQ